MKDRKFINLARKLLPCLFAVALALLCAFALPTEAEAATEGYYTYTVSDGEATITWCNTSISGDVIIPSTLGGYPVTSIGYSAFDCCENLNSITIPDSVISIGDYAFAGCWSLNSITIPDSVTSIGGYAFCACGSLKSITIPDSVISIGDYAFTTCWSLTTILVTDGNSNYSSDANGVLFNRDKTLLIAAPGGITGSYTIPNSVISIGGYAFSDCSRLTSVSVGNEVTDIGFRAFASCNSLTSITIPDSVTSIGDETFYYCSSLENITIPERVTSIGVMAFEGCSGLRNVTIPSSVTSIGDSAFGLCGSLKSITIPDSVTSIGEGTFGYCDNLTNITIPGSVTSIGRGAFSGCSSLESITILDGVTSIGDETFRNCSSLKSITIPDSVTSIGGYAFYDCSSLKSITIPGGVTSIGNSAFWNCSSLNHVAYAGTQTQWAEVTVGTNNGALTGAANFHYETVFAYVESCVATSVYCPVCQEFIVQEERSAHTYEDGVCSRCGENGQHSLVLTKDTQVDWSLIRDMHIDLNGFNLTGTIITNGYKVYGMDSKTDSYTCENIGYFNCVDENGDIIVPERIYIEGEKQYMAICVEDRYSFHRFFVGITHMTLAPETVGLGYKSAIFGDEMVFAQLAATKAFSFRVQLEGYNPVYRSFDSDELASGDPITLRIRNYDVENYSEHNLYAQVSLTLNDGTVIEAEQVSLTFRWLTEQVNANYTDYTNDQITQFKAMLQQFDIVKKWDIPNLV